MSSQPGHSGQVQLWRHLHWKQTWLSLHGQQLQFCKSAEEKTPLLTIDLLGATVTDNANSLIIVSPHEKAKIRLSSNAEKEDWVRHIQAAIQSAGAHATSPMSNSPPHPSSMEKMMEKLHLGSFLGHSSKCVDCGTKVTSSDAWPSSHPERPYHKQCWDAHCSKALQPGPYLQQWAAAHPNAEVPELAHILAAMVKQPLPDGVATLLKAYPSLPTKPVAGEGGRTAFHLAARRGDLPMLKMLQCNSNRLDYGWVTDDHAPHSLLLKGCPGAKDDVYIPQPSIDLNTRPVFLGHTHGWYLFYYDNPDAGAEDSADQSGWYVAEKLGVVGANAAQVPLADPLDSTKPLDSPKSNQANGLKVQWLPHVVSVLDEAIASGNAEMIKEVIRCYKAAHAGGTLWKHHTGSGLWDVYPAATQSEIHKAASQGEQKLSIHLNGDAGLPATLYFQQMEQQSAHHKTAIKSELLALFQHRNSENGPLTITSDTTGLDSHQAAILFSPLHGAEVACDLSTLELLVAEGVLDFSMWCPPCNPKYRCPEIHSSALQGMLQSIVDKEVKKLTQRDGNEGTPVSLAASVKQSAFYPSDYSADIETLPFCAQLPANPHGMHFELSPIIGMAADALMKVHELQRQHLDLSTSGIVSIFVYTYELPYNDVKGAQISKEMDRAMVANNPQLISFWRPLIWRLDQALERLPPFTKGVYRGVPDPVNHDEHETGEVVVWPSFCIATSKMSYAEEFSSSPTYCSLFFIDSISGKSISQISRFPDAQEVLFVPNSKFEVTSALFVTGGIGVSYGKCDSIAVKQVK